MQQVARKYKKFFSFLQNESICLLFCLSLSYSLVTRFSDFFLAPRAIKVQLIGFVMVISGILYFLLPKQLFKIQLYRDNQNQFLSGAIVALILLTFFIPPLAFPENQTLIVTPSLGSDTGHFIIESFQRIQLPENELQPIFPSQIEFYGSGWDYGEDQDSISWTGNTSAHLKYSRLMQAGIRIQFATGPNFGSVKIAWDGSDRLVNLNEANQGFQVVELKPSFRWSNLGWFQKILVGSAYIAEYAAITISVVSIILLPKVFVFRQKKLIWFSFTVSIFLLLIISLLDPIITFNDRNLEYQVREVIGILDGDIRRHHVITLVKLDLSESGIKDLGGIEKLINLENLNLRDNEITSIQQLAGLTDLRKLDLRGNQIVDINELSNLRKLEYLNLRENPIKDLSPITKLTALRSLNINGIPFSFDELDFSPLARLENLNIRNCGIRDISPLAVLMAEGMIQDDPISGRKAEIDLRDNPITLTTHDGYAAIRPFWENISLRAPFVLPESSLNEPPQFSHLGGFYEQAFFLELAISDPNATIHYTNDGSIPTIDSPQFTTPIHIQFQNEDQNQAQVNQSIGGNQHGSSTDITKTSIIRAASFYPDGSKSRTITQTFILNQGSYDQSSLPVMALSTDQIGRASCRERV